MQSELTETKSQLESERDALRAELSSVSSSRDAERFARCALSLRVACLIASLRLLACSAEIARELAETKSSLESERDALQAQLVELSKSAPSATRYLLSCRLLKMRSWRRRSRRSFLSGMPRLLACSLILLR